MKLNSISEDLKSHDVNIYTNRPKTQKLYFYELPDAVQRGISQLISYDDISYIIKWLDGFFVMTKYGKELGFKADGSQWSPDTELDQETEYSSNRVR